MQLMQYEITLPADYDMGIIRHRVATRGSKTDEFPDLGLKAYLVRERGSHGSPVNQYAPFYSWVGPGGMNQFLFGSPLEGIRADFGRPIVRTWQTVGVFNGPVPSRLPIAATRDVAAVDPGEALDGVVSRLLDQAIALADHPDLNAVAVGIDPFTWQQVHFALWNGEPPHEEPGDRYDVLHLSQPKRGSLPEGRAW
ncbi:MAG: DUF4865 family protein [Nocardioides sp.]|nr:DUF4865 family protein [Nocardioidaceae bacterium]MCB8957826.1 DUF4865 family protein [Nocardioides sp.]